MFDNDKVKYDIILGTYVLSKTGIRLNYAEGEMEWFDCSIPLHPPGGLDAKDFNAMEDMFFVQTEDELFGEDWLIVMPQKPWMHNMNEQMSLMLLTS